MEDEDAIAEKVTKGLSLCHLCQLFALGRACP